MSATLASRISTYPDTRVRKPDLTVIALLILGIFQIATVQVVESFGWDSSVYMGLAQSILDTGRYEFNFKPHTVYPPGFPGILALLTVIAGHGGFDVFIRFMPVFSTLALIVWYFVLKRSFGQLAASASCLLVATSAGLFRLVTRFVLSESPFFLVSGVALWCVMRLETLDGQRSRMRYFLVAGLCFATVLSVLLRSAGVALCGAVLAWTVTEMWRRRSTRSSALRAGAFAAVLGLAVFLCWIVWAKRAEPNDYQSQHQDYTSQFRAKDPHHPELGNASAVDFIVRMVSNVPVQVSHIAAVATRVSYITPSWYSPVAGVAIGLLTCGLISCAFDSGATLLAWYFVAYFAMLLLWPFDEGPRYILPATPLALALFWRGILVLIGLLRSRAPATLGVIAAVASVFTVVTFASDRLPGLQSKLAIVFWPLLVIASLASMWLAKRFGQLKVQRGTDLLIEAFRAYRIHYVILALLLVIGLFEQATIADANLAPDPPSFIHNSSAEASTWLRNAKEGVVMAQQSAIVHRLTGRRTVLFPVTSDPKMIADVVQRENVRYLVVNDRLKYEYFFPTEEERMVILQRAYPSMFQLVHRGPGYRVFEVQPAAH